MPARRSAICRAVASLSPASITTRRPWPFICRTASALPGRITSATPSTPSRPPSAAKYSGVMPFPASAAPCASSAGSVSSLLPQEGRVTAGEGHALHLPGETQSHHGVHLLGGV